MALRRTLERAVPICGPAGAGRVKASGGDIFRQKMPGGHNAGGPLRFGPFFWRAQALESGRRGVAQSGSAAVLGTVGRRFESYRPDQLFISNLGAG